jgi:LEA14-like dessication related protein
LLKNDGKDHLMRKLLWLLGTVVLFCTCQLKEQAEELSALQNCTYEIISADSVSLANVEISNMVNEHGIDLVNAPALALSYLQKKLPLQAVINLRVTNPGTTEAGINQFEYKVLVQETEVLDGSYDKRVTIAPQSSTVIPVKINRDVYNLISNPANQSAVANFLDTRTEKKSIITMKIKPAIAVGDRMIHFPDYINLKKEVSNTVLLSYIRNLPREQ